MDTDFIQIDNIVLNSEIVSSNFTCDLAKCKGACCIMESPYGAPITKDEIRELQEVLSTVLEYLPKQHVAEIEKKGFWVKQQDELMTRSINNRACVFVYFDGDIAKCAIERAFKDGKINSNKPVSCHLFPIRISNFAGPVLRYEKYRECQPAVEKGKKTLIKVIDFCKDALERLYGKEWFIKVKEVVKK